MRRRTDPAAGALTVSSIALLILVACCVVATLGCGTTETVRVVREEVPVAYWSPPELKDLPPETPLQSQRITEDEAKADPTRAHIAIADDLAALLEENALLRWLYTEAVTLCTVPPTGGDRLDDPPGREPTGGGGGAPTPDP